MEVLNVTSMYKGDTYILYPFFNKLGNLILVNSNNGELLGKCIGCDGTGDKYGKYEWDCNYVFSLNGRKTTYSHDFLFANHKALVLAENTSKKVIRIKTESNNEQKILQDSIFFDGDIIRKLLFDCLPKLHIDNYIDIILMIVGFGRVNRLCYEASKEIKAKIISSLESLVPSYGIETFRLTPEVGKLYNTDEDSCKIICNRNNKKQSEEFFEKEHLKHQYNVRIYTCLNMMIDKNANKQEVAEAEKEAIESVKKLWYLNQHTRFNSCIGGGESPTFITSNREEESKIKFYFLLHHSVILVILFVLFLINH